MAIFCGQVEADENDSFWFGGLTVNLELPFIYTGVYGTNYIFTVNDFNFSLS